MNNEWRLRLQCIEFNTEYGKELDINTLNHAEIPVWPIEPRKLISFLPGHDLAWQYAAHQAVCRHHAGARKKIVDLYQSYHGDAARSFADSMNRETLSPLRAGYIYLIEGEKGDSRMRRISSQCLRAAESSACFVPSTCATLKGAYLMTWRQIWPIKPIISWWNVRQSYRRLEATGFERHSPIVGYCGLAEQASPHSAACSSSSMPNATRAVAAVTPLLTADVTATSALSSSSLSPMARAFSIRLRVQIWHPRVMVTAGRSDASPLTQQLRAVRLFDVIYDWSVVVCHRECSRCWVLSILEICDRSSIYGLSDQQANASSCSHRLVGLPHGSSAAPASLSPPPGTRDRGFASAAGRSPDRTAAPAVRSS